MYFVKMKLDDEEFNTPALENAKASKFQKSSSKTKYWVNNYLGIRSATTSLQQVDDYKMNTFEVEHPSIYGLAVTQIL